MIFLQPWMHIPELGHLPPSERKRIWLELVRIWRRRVATNRAGNFIALWIVVAAIILLLVSRLTFVCIFQPLSWGGSREARYLNITLVLLVGTPFFVYFRYRSIRRLIGFVMQVNYAGRLMPACPQCGYNLSGCGDTTLSCPECGNTQLRGKPTHEMIRHANPYRGLF